MSTTKINRQDSSDATLLNEEMAGLIAAKDWSDTPLGPMETWSPALRMVVNFLLASRFPLLLWWGSEYISIYNDAYRPILGSKHPWALGQPVRECWSEIWHVLKPLIDTPFNGGPATWMDDILLEINRHGFVEETHFTIGYSAVPDEAADGGIGGVMATVHETTDKVVGERRLRALRDLGVRVMEGQTAEATCTIAADVIAEHALDVPFAMLYLIAADGFRARLAGAAGVAEGSTVSPAVIDLGDTSAGGWPLSEAMQCRTAVTVADLPARFGDVPPGPWSDPPHSAVVVPIRSSTSRQLAGLLLAGVSPRQRLDSLYFSFFELMATQIGTAITKARAYEEERRRAEELAELDRAKTTFFSNVSHEFRTPLTLMLAPLEDVLDRLPPGALSDDQRRLLDTARRNSLRLLKMVNTLLDFSRVEAGRGRAVFQPTDLASLTADLASSFRSVCERAGLTLSIVTPPLPEPVFVDRDTWEKIVLNLISNAFKFTFSGRIDVAVTAQRDHAVLSVSDTGTGIPASELPHIFQRFHRVEGARGRSYEGTGIGLALVRELVRLHKGSIEVDSTLGQGSRFLVRIPFGSAHLPNAQVNAGFDQLSAPIRANSYVSEALRWMSDKSLDVASDTTSGRARVLVADDNADMRDYLTRLLASDYDVVAVADGQEALAAVEKAKPDLILSDVMMPRLDGFGLIRRLRESTDFKDIPVILLSARAGEEATVEGLGVGAVDYMIKPFSARELLARIAMTVQQGRAKARSMETMRETTQRLEEQVAHVQAERDLMADIMEVTGTFIQVLDPDFRLLALNDANAREYERIYGFRPRVGDCILDYLSDRPDLRPAVQAIWTRALSGETFTETAEFGDPARERRWYELRFSPLLGSDGGVIGAYQFSTDVTERLREQTRLAEAEEQLRHSQKMEAVGQLTGGIAHDFNNLLAGITGSLELMHTRLAQGRLGELNRYVAAAQGAANRAASLTHRLLAFSRRQTLDPKPVNLNRLVAGMEDLIRRAMGPAITIEVVAAGGLWISLVDPGQFENALLNLCINARDAMPDGGRLTIETANKWLDDRAARERQLPPGQFVTVCVSDTGVGMPPEVIQRAFDPFFTTKPTGMGTGLGLSMVYGFARQSGGQARIYSEPGQGTTVCLYLPRQFESEDRNDLVVEKPVPRDVHRTGTVLVVDDEPTVRMLVTEVLADLGYAAIEAADGAAGLAALQSDAHIDLLITDVGLPGGMNGRQVADAGQGLRSGLKVLFITGYAENAAIGNGQLEPGMHVLTKPFSVDELARRVTALMTVAA